MEFADQTPTRVLIAESHEIIRLGLRFLISNQNNLEIVAESEDIQQLITLAEALQPEVILLDLSITGLEINSHIPQLIQVSPHSKVLAFTRSNNQETHLQALRAGAVGIVAKHQTAKLLLKAIQSITVGEFWFDRNLAKLLWQPYVPDHMPNADVTLPAICQLTEKECMTACLAAKGVSARQIAEQLFISEKYVRNLLTRAYQKLEVNGHVELCLKAAQFGFCQHSAHARNCDVCPNRKR